MRNKFLMLCSFLILGIQAWAFQGSYVQYLNQSSFGTPSSTVPKLSILDPSVGLTAAAPVYTYKVSLKYTRNQLSDLINAQAWTYTLNLGMNIYTNSGTLAGQVPTFNLTISNASSLAPTSSVYEAVALYDVQYAYLNNPQASLFITGITSTGSVPADIVLELTQIQTLTEPFAGNSVTALTLNFSNTNTLSWNYVTGAQSYDLEWVYIDSYDQVPFTASTTDVTSPFTFKEPICVSTANQSFTFHNTYSSGTIYFRIRAVTYNSTTQVATKGTWNYNNATSVAQIPNMVNTADFEPLKNWQTTTVFIENGKYKKNIEFADGSMRGRQSQTSMNSDGTVVISETKYDFEGRPSINVMPFPYNVSTTMNYVANANVFGSYQIGTSQQSAYDNSNYKYPLSTSSGASQYYSPSNTFQTTNQAAYIPDAQGYPYSQVVYTPDNTGRIAQKTDVGIISAIQGGALASGQHFTQKYYSTPSSTELYRMFGTNVGNASHYTKTYTIDPNGVVSISYQDPEGKVIATALNEQPSNSVVNVNDPYNQTTLYGGASETYQLSHNNSVNPSNHVSISTDKIVNLTTPNTYTFNYNLTSMLDAFNGGCLDCEYTFELSITDPTGASIITNGTTTVPYYTQDLIPTVSACSSATYAPINLSYTFNSIGEYTVTKKLYYRSASIQSLTSSILAGTPVQVTFNNKTYTSESAFATDYITYKEAIANCGLSCITNCTNYQQTFVNQINPATNLTYSASDLTNIYNTCMTQCNALGTNAQNQAQNDRCSSYKSQMLDQLSPGGFYNNNGVSTDWPNNTTFISNLLAGGFAFTQEGNGVVTAAMAEDPNQFNQQWALDLLPKHPEYCVYKNLCANTTNPNYQAALNARAAYDNSFQSVTDPSALPLVQCGWNYAATSGYLMPIATTIPPFTVVGVGTVDLSSASTAQQDPFYIQSGLPSTAVQTALIRYYDETVNGVDLNQNGTKTDMLSAWEYASNYFVANLSTNGSSPGFINTIPANYDQQRWKVFQGIYMQIKDNFINTQIIEAGGCTISDPTLPQTVIQLQPQSTNQTQSAMSSAAAPSYSASSGVSTNIVASNPDFVNVQNGIVNNSQGLQYNNIPICDDQSCMQAAYSVLNQLNVTCPNIATLTKADSAVVLSALSFYFKSNCTTNNPEMYILSTDVGTNKYLIAAQNVLTNYGCTLQSIETVLSQQINCFTITPAANQFQPSTDIQVYVALINDYLNLFRNSIAPNPTSSDPNQPANAGNFCTTIQTQQAAMNFYPINQLPSGIVNQSYWTNIAGFCGQTNSTPCTFQKVAITQNPTTKLIQMYFLNGDNVIYYTESGILEDIKSTGLPLSQVQQIQNLTPITPTTNVPTPIGLNYQVLTTSGSVISLSCSTSPLILNNNFSPGNFVTFSFCDSYGNSNPYLYKAPYLQAVQPYMVCDPFAVSFSSTAWSSNCVNEASTIANAEAQNMWNDLASQQLQSRLDAHYTACFSTPFSENFSYSVTDYKQLYYTLYYYDQAGNLVQTVPPEGVRLLGSSAFDNAGNYKGAPNPVHGLITNYQYNSLNQLIYKITPDESGSSHNIPTYTFYNDKGQVVLSQNAKQSPNNAFTYITYDNLGRVQSSSEITNSTLLAALLNPANYDQNVTNYWNTNLLVASNTPTDIIYNTYDAAVGGNQNYTSRGRLTEVTRSQTLTQYTATQFDSYISYQYDIHGNVSHLVNALPLSSTNANEVIAFTLDYSYDLISGSVQTVILDNGLTSQMTHQYCYDADNRLKKVKTSRNNLVWEEDARYFYYLHGPVARVELGHDNIQGQDYYYTLQGWIKGLNTPSQHNTYTFGGNIYNFSGDTDVGLDGSSINTGNNNKFVAQDEYMMNLGYNTSDYSPVNAAVASLGDAGVINVQNLWYTFATAVTTTASGHGLYNGNIAWWISDRSRVNNTQAVRDNAYIFQYDQLNRLQNAFYNNTNIAPVNTELQWAIRSVTPAGASTPGPNDFTASYDLNGNIKTLKRLDPSGNLIDNLSYNYNYQGGGQTGMLLDNHLGYITDQNTIAYGNYDIVNQSAANYAYDNIGNLRGDGGTGSVMTWNREGKILTVTHTTGLYSPDLVFKYDANGKRIFKQSTGKTNGLPDNTKIIYTYYAYDASGNVMATYDRVADGTGYDVRQVDASVYVGSKRLGVIMLTTPIVRSTLNGTTLAFTNYAINTEAFNRVPAQKVYELTDHLGNIRTTVAGIKYGIEKTGDLTLDYYVALVLTENDYYPFGILIGGTGYRFAGMNDYRFGYNGKPMDTDWNGDGAMYDYGFRIYDPRICKFLSVDPLAPDYSSWSPYAFAMNRPIDGVDLDGLEFFPSSFSTIYDPNAHKEVANMAVKGSESALHSATFASTSLFSSTGNGFMYAYLDIKQNGLAKWGEGIGVSGYIPYFSAYGFSYQNGVYSKSIHQYYDGSLSFEDGITILNGVSLFIPVAEGLYGASSFAKYMAYKTLYGRGVPMLAEGFAAKTSTSFADDAIRLTTSSKSIAPSRTYTIFDGSGQLYKFGVTDANLARYGQSLRQAGPGAYGKFSSIMPKNQAHIMEKYLRSLHYNSTGQYALPGMKIPYPVNFNTGLPIKP